MTVTIELGNPMSHVQVARLSELKEGDLILLVEEDPQEFEEDDPEYTHAVIDRVRVVLQNEKGVRFDGPCATLRTEGASAPDNDPIYEEDDFTFSASGGYRPVKIWRLNRMMLEKRS